MFLSCGLHSADANELVDASFASANINLDFRSSASKKTTPVNFGIHF